MTALILFSFEDQQLRVQRNGEMWFVAADVCAALGVEHHRDAIQRLDDDERASVLLDTPGGPQQVAAISEAGVYRLIFTSRKPEAERFKRWLAHEVLPALRRTGQYGEPRRIAYADLTAGQRRQLDGRAKQLLANLRSAQIISMREVLLQRLSDELAAGRLPDIGALSVDAPSPESATPAVRDDGAHDYERFAAEFRAAAREGKAGTGAVYWNDEIVVFEADTATVDELTVTLSGRVCGRRRRT